MSRNDWTLDDGRIISLVTPAELQYLANGTPLYSIMGEKVIVGVDEIDQDTRFGYLAYGQMNRNRDE